VRRALRELPVRYRAAVILKDMADLSYEEVGRVLGCPLGTVESRIHRGRLTLRKKLERALQR
jgi:RNA polymerase sigma-70 factor (ECF subfamily)